MGQIELAVIIPVYNEGAVIGSVISQWMEGLQRLGINFRLHVYNDGSKDNTLQILRNLGCQYTDFIVHNKKNKGHGPTILEGYRKNFDAEWIFQVDSDDEIGFESFEEFWRNRNKYQFLIGRRRRPDQLFRRKLISISASLLVRVFYGSKLSDVNCPYRLMKVACFKKTYYSLPDNVFAPNVIISGVAARRKLKICEIPVAYQIRKTGGSSLETISLLKAILKSFWQTIIFRFKI